eukprot:Gb_37935 [translate_table: standard]
MMKTVKNLLTIRPEDDTSIRDVTIRKIPRVPEHMPLYDILNEFQKGHSHIAVVVKYSKERMDRDKELKSQVDRRLVNTRHKRRSDTKAVTGHSRACILGHAQYLIELCHFLQPMFTLHFYPAPN